MTFDNENTLHICKEEVIAAFSNALTKLFEKDAQLFVFDVQERAIAARLAMYLREEFLCLEKHGITIDVEYNRDGKDVKRHHDTDEDGWIAPDIILHQRGSGENGEYKNDIFYCEMKKNSKSDADDATKVKEQMEERKYKYGIDLYSIGSWAARLDLYLRSSSTQKSIIRSSFYYEQSCHYLIHNK